MSVRGIDLLLTPVSMTGKSCTDARVAWLHSLSVQPVPCKSPACWGYHMIETASELSIRFALSMNPVS
jgi:hypothetical protein